MALDARCTKEVELIGLESDKFGFWVQEKVERRREEGRVTAK